jgi:predicted secreted protein
MNGINYYLIIDNSTQWLQFIVRMIGDYQDQAVQIHGIEGSFSKNIYRREYHFTNKEFKSFNNQTFYGWTISDMEYERLKQLNLLAESARLYNELKEL